MEQNKLYGLFGLYDTESYCYRMAEEIASKDFDKFHFSFFRKGLVKNSNAIAFYNAALKIENYINGFKTPLLKHPK